MQTTFQVFASYISAISGDEVQFQLVKHAGGTVFRNIETGKIETGTYAEGDCKFASLDLFRSIFREMQPSFELK